MIFWEYFIFIWESKIAGNSCHHSNDRVKTRFDLRYVTLRYGILRYITLCYVTLRYGILRYVALRYVMLRYVTVYYVTLRYGILRSVTLRYVTVYYVTLCYVTLRYITLRCVTVYYVTLRYGILRYVTLCYVVFSFSTPSFYNTPSSPSLNNSHPLHLRLITLHYCFGFILLTPFTFCIFSHVMTYTSMISSTSILFLTVRVFFGPWDFVISSRFVLAASLKAFVRSYAIVRSCIGVRVLDDSSWSWW